ncbi:unnamed protein product [Pedinophyceae sp. YPF-701]|nr:unnamed protein product [Pedinophyceae sp. YPF-701]
MLGRLGARAAGRWATAAAAAAACAAGAGGVALAKDSFKDYFDPEALERGAKALKEIEKSKNAKSVLELAKEQEKARAAEAGLKAAQSQEQAARINLESERVRAEEQRKTNDQMAQRQAEIKRYEDELARNRAAAQHEKERERQVELVRLQEESERRREAEKLRIQQEIEAERRRTEEYRAEQKRKVQAQRALAEAEGRIKERRENEDVYRREMVLKYGEETKKAIAVAQAWLSGLGSGVNELIEHADKGLVFVSGLGLVAAFVYGAREGTRVAGRAIERYLTIPSLVRESSYTRPWDFVKRSKQANMAKPEAISRGFSDVVLPAPLKEHVQRMAASTANTRVHRAPFRHMLFYGPPGTGKTLVAKKLARTSGLDYAIMSGGDVAPLGGHAVTELHKLFDWAESSTRGLMVFIDEADAFLGRRGAGQSEGLRGALNALLFRTGDQSRDFVVVLCTNRPSDLDAAVLDRIDEAVEFPLPGEAERKLMLELYIDQYIAKAGTEAGGAGSESGGGLLSKIGIGRGAPVAIKVAGVEDSHIAEAARLCDGFSGREIAKMVASVQAACYGSHNLTLTPELLLEVVKRKVAEHGKRDLMKEEGAVVFG